MLYNEELKGRSLEGAPTGIRAPLNVFAITACCRFSDNNCFRHAPFGELMV